MLMPEPRKLDVSDIGQKVAIVASEPRFGPLDPKQCVMLTAGAFGMEVRKHSGAYWSQSLMLSAKSVLNERSDLEYLLTVDFDSMFRPADVLKLYALAKLYPHTDAICACQLKRETGEVLMSRTGGEATDELLQIQTGHFGLTLFKASKLRGIAGPWFLRTPIGDAPDATMDEDIYFWRAWEGYGHSAYLAPQVRIGQLEVVVTVPGDNFKPVRQSIGEWERASR